MMKSDLQALEKMMHQLGVEIDLRVQGLWDYEAPDYKFILDILMDRLSSETEIPGKEFIWSLSET
jgi:hypothetical protein